LDRERKHRRMTHQRSVILEEVKLCQGHPKADEVYERVRVRLPQISMGTVYRNLDVLASNGLIRKLGPEFPQMRFDGNTEDHYHITCMECGRIEDMHLEPEDDPASQLEKALGKLTKYGVFGHKLEFMGLCPECAGKKGNVFQEPQDEELFQEENDHGTEGK
jgi:Fe2+ or Zn2+ uptake regulation protein